jgi:hypothetical protein
MGTFNTVRVDSGARDAGEVAAVDPGRFVGQLFPTVLGLLNSVMTARPSAYVRLKQPRLGSGPGWCGGRNRLTVSVRLRSQAMPPGRHQPSRLRSAGPSSSSPVPGARKLGRIAKDLRSSVALSDRMIIRQENFLSAHAP